MSRKLEGDILFTLFSHYLVSFMAIYVLIVTLQH